MVSIKKLEKNGKSYYYLRYHSGILDRQEYLGTKIPANIKQVKLDFQRKIQSEIWQKQLEPIKKEHSVFLKKAPQSVIKQSLEEFSYRFTYNTQKIEGSTLTEQETENLLRYNITPNKKPHQDTLEAQEHHSVFLKITQDKDRVTLDNIVKWHDTIFAKTQPSIAGKIRTYPVYVRGSKTKFPHYKMVPAFLKQYFVWLKLQHTKTNPVELAGLAHFRFVTIHPFGDGNGRISRLIMNSILHQGGYPMLNIKYAQRKFYYSALEKATNTPDENIFLKWFIKYYIRQTAS